MLTDKQIKEHEIKLTSSDIIDSYERSKRRKPSFSFRKLIYIAVPACLVVSVSAVLIVKALNKNPINPVISDVIDQKEGSRISNALVSSLCLIDSSDKASSLNMKLRMQNKEDEEESSSITEDEFKKIVDSYEYADNLVELQLDSSKEIYQKIEKYEYKGVYDTYEYMITISGDETIKYYLNYTNDKKNVSFLGEVTYENVTYKLEGKNKIKDDESEYEYTAYLDENNYVTIQEEKEVDEYSYEYKMVKNGEELYSLSYEKEEDVELVLKTSDNEYTFTIDYSSSIWNIAYEDETYQGNMTLERKDNQKIYTDNSTKIKVIK